MFLVFAGRDNSNGGWKDKQGDFFNEEISIKYAERLYIEHGYDWSHVVDLDTGKIIWES